MEKRMMLSRAHATVGAAVLLGATILLQAAPASAACRAPREAYARGALQTATELIARSRWRSEVRGAYGLGFARWSLAKDKTMRCRKIQPGSRWHCVARARPCNSR
jgi:hypothetical protein